MARQFAWLPAAHQVQPVYGNPLLALDASHLVSALNLRRWRRRGVAQAVFLGCLKRNETLVK